MSSVDYITSGKGGGGHAQVMWLLRCVVNRFNICSDAQNLCFTGVTKETFLSISLEGKSFDKIVSSLDFTLVYFASIIFGVVWKL